MMEASAKFDLFQYSEFREDGEVTGKWNGA